jgi:hypothetical protein
MSSARSACNGSGTTTVAVVPRARNEREVKLGCADATVDVLISVYRPR